MDGFGEIMTIVLVAITAGFAVFTSSGALVGYYYNHTWMGALAGAVLYPCALWLASKVI